MKTKVFLTTVAALVLAGAATLAWGYSSRAVPEPSAADATQATVQKCGTSESPDRACCVRTIICPVTGEEIPADECVQKN